MIDYIYIGKIVNTHGIKGELRLISDFKYKDRVFKKGTHIYIGRKKEEEVVTSYRHHKNFEMITLEGYTDINEVLKYKGLSAFVSRSDLALQNDEYLDEDLIGLKAYSDDQLLGEVIELRDSGGKNKLLVIKTNNKDIYIPFQKEFIKSIDFKEKKIDLIIIKGMI